MRPSIQSQSSRRRITIWAVPEHFRNFIYAYVSRNRNSPSMVTFSNLASEWLASFPEAPADFTIPEAFQSQPVRKRRHKRAA